MNSNLSPINTKSNSINRDRSNQQSLNLLKEIYNDCVQESCTACWYLGFLYSIEELPASHKFEAYYLTKDVCRSFSHLFHNADQDNCAKLLSINKDIIYIKT